MNKAQRLKEIERLAKEEKQRKRNRFLDKDSDKAKLENVLADVADLAKKGTE